MKSHALETPVPEVALEDKKNSFSIALKSTYSQVIGTYLYTIVATAEGGSTAKLAS